ncbi:MAG TPA: ABC transporter permease [Anaerolineales bacterium]|nr:ABC transporter permease [Anaerolineales bacterium]
MADWVVHGRRGRPARANGAGLRDLWRWASLPFAVFLFLPLIALLLRATPERLWETLGTRPVQQAVGLSLRTAAAATGLSIALGTPVAYVLARRRFRLKRLVEALVDLPVVLPPAVAGLALLMAFGRRGLLGGALEALGIPIGFSPTAVVLAQTFVAAPYYVRAAAIGFSQVQAELEQAASIDGASGRQVFLKVTVPLAWHGLVSGAALTWARALGEFGATIIFAGNFPGRTQTMPLAIYLGFQFDLDVALTLAVILGGFSALTLILVRTLLQQEPPAGGS